MDDIIALE